MKCLKCKDNEAEPESNFCTACRKKLHDRDIPYLRDDYVIGREERDDDNEKDWQGTV